jgi:urease accessory protein
MTRRLNIAIGALSAVGGFFMLAGAAEAHPADAASGFLHPFLGLDHLLAMVAVGLWAVQIAERTGRNVALWAVPGAFVAMMAAGAWGALAGMATPVTELGIIGSLVVLGGLVAMAPRLPIWAGMIVAGTFALFHGHAHGAELPEGISPAVYMAGFMAATALLHVAGIALGLVLRRTDAAQVSLRLSGAAVATFGVFLFLAG